MKIIAAALVLGLLMGCSSQQITKNAMSEDPTIAQKPKAYQDGFSDGCNSGVKEARAGWYVHDDKFVRDDERMKKDADYALGWNDGARRCIARFGGGGGFMYVAPSR